MGYTPKNFTRNAVKIQKSNVLIQPDDPYRRQFIKFINTLKCPICQSDLDGSIAEQANLYCRLNPEEYNVQYTRGSYLPDASCIKIWTWLGSFKIDHKKIRPTGVGEETQKYSTIIWRLVEEGFSLPQHEFIMEHEGEMLFSASSFNEDDFLKKMELYDVFS